jgi:adenosylhomocysteine nucleosidase
MHQQKPLLCIVFPMGIEAYPFLRRVEVVRRWTREKVTFREAFFEGKSLLIVRTGIGPERAARAMRVMEERPSAIVTVGTAGALDPGLRKKELIVVSETVSADEPGSVVRCTGELVRALTDACRKGDHPFRAVRIATARNPVFRRADREQLQRITGAHAVDMETHAIALEASRLGVPFASLRVVSDDVNAPPLPDRRALKGLWRRPTQWADGLSGLLKWRGFMKDFFQAVECLHPVLVRMLRDCGKDGGFSASCQEPILPERS